MKRAWTRRVLIGLVAFVTIILIAFGWLGYLSRDPFTTLRPDGYQARAGAPVAILLSGDMGIRVGMGNLVAHRLERDGIAVIGVNTLTFFRTTRTPADATLLIEEALQRAKMLNPAGRIILIGQSFGADMLHVGLAHLPVAQRRDIALVALVVPGATVEYRASPSELFTFLIHEADALPTARALDWVPLLCIGGIEEKASLCPLLHQRNLRAISMPGGHQLNWDVDGVEGQIINAIADLGQWPSA